MSRSKGDAMVSKPSPAWAMLSRVLDRLLSELSEDDLSDLFARLEAEGTAAGY
jgi:hypothetical protein